MDVSIVIPAFNAAETIATSVRSIIAAKRSYSIEVLIVDDASTDNTWGALQALAQLYPEVKPLKNNRLKGPSGARNTGLDNATGNYIAFLDADDVWYENHLELGVSFLAANPTYGLALFNHRVIDEADGKVLGDWMSGDDHYDYLINSPQEIVNNKNLVIYNALLRQSFLHMSAAVIKAEYVKAVRFDESVFRHEDRDFGMQLALAGVRFKIDKLITSIYYRSSNSLTTVSINNDLKGLSDKEKIMLKHYVAKAGDFTSHTIISDELGGLYITRSYLLRQKKEYTNSFRAVMKSYSYVFSMAQMLEVIKIILAAVTKR